MGLVSSTTITYGSEYVFNPAVTYYPSIVKLDPTKIVVTFRDGGDNSHGKAVVGAISGTVITYDSLYTFNPRNSQTAVSAAALDSSSFVVAYFDYNSDSFRGHAIVGLVSGTTITFGSEYGFYSTNFGSHSVMSFDSSTFGISFVDQDYMNNYNNGNGVTMVGKVLDGQLIGTATESANAGEPVNVCLAGLSNGFSALTPGTLYYATFEGMLTTDKTPFIIGLAISDTEIILSNSTRPNMSLID